jgi:hypothetical protein
MTSARMLNHRLTVLSVPSVKPMTSQTCQPTLGSITMYTMYEALARDRMREARSEAQQRRTVQVLSAHKRWRRLERRAQAARQRVGQAQRRNALHVV